MLNRSPWCSSLFGSTAVCIMCNTTVKDVNLHLAWYHDGSPNIFGPGLHNLCCFWSEHRTMSAASDHIEHGPVFIITIPQGMLGYGVEKGVPILLAPGRHKIMSYEFIWRRNIDLKETEIEIGEWTLVRVDFGRVGVATLAGKMRILRPGLHMFEPPDVFLRFVNTRLQILQLPQCVQESSDYVPLVVKANISYFVKDPLRLIQRIQDQQAALVITEVATAAIAAIIRSSTLGDMAMASQVDEVGHQIEGETFHEKMHAKFMSQVGKPLLMTTGIEISNINIEQLRIKDMNLAALISAQAVKISELEAQHKTLKKEGEGKRQQAEIEKDVAEERAEADYIVTVKRAEAAKLKALCEAEAKAKGIQLKSDAEIEAFIQRSIAEAEHAERMDTSSLHQELALVKARMDPQVKALSGMKEIAYVPHLPAIVQKSGASSTVNGALPEIKN